MIKKFLTFMFLVFFLILSFSNSIKAITYDDGNNAGYEVTNHTLTDLNGGVLHVKDIGNTIKNSIKYPQQTNVLTMKTGENAKVVTWAVKDASKAGFVRQTVASIAKDYEKNHPGWSVIGAINGDQYYTKFGTAIGADGSDYFYPQPYYPMIADYQNWFAITATPYNNGHIVGFKNDGSTNPLVYQNAGWQYTGASKASILGLFLSITDAEGNTQKFAIDHINQTPDGGKNSLYTPYYTGTSMNTVFVQGEHVFVVESSELAYMSNSTTYTYKTPHNQNAFFGKGDISRITTEFTLQKGQFAIVASEQGLIDALDLGENITVQYEFDGPLSEVESGIGFHQIMRSNNTDHTSSATYNTSLYPRAMFGRQADGTMVLVTVDGRQAEANMVGVNMHESNAILKHYGVVEGYQVDGGGSVTMVVRDGNDFVTVNSPSDGSNRSVLNAILMVVKDLDVETNFVEILPNAITFKVDIRDILDGPVYIRMNNELKEIVDSQVTFDNLEPNTMYRYQYVTTQNGELTTSVVSGAITSAKRTPYVEMVRYYKDYRFVIIEVEFVDPDLALVRRQIQFFWERHTLTRKQIVLESRDGIDFNQIAVYMSYDLNDGNGRQDVTSLDHPIRCDLTSLLSHMKNNLREEVRKVYE